MDELIPTIRGWLQSGRKVALATVIETWGSSPRPPGSNMAVTDEQQIAGSVSGGCVEGAVVEAAQTVLISQKPERLHFGVSNDQAWDVGLACGGEIDVFLRYMQPVWLDQWEKARADDQSFCLVLVTRGPDELVGTQWIQQSEGNIIAVDVPEKELNRAQNLAAQALVEGTTGEKELREASSPGEATRRYFLQVVDPQLQLIAVGGGHISKPLVQLAEVLGFHCTVIDPRRLFGSRERFPGVDELIQSWPQEAFSRIKITRQTAVVMLTHDPKIDDPALEISLNSEAFYIGALGSRKTHEKRKERLRRAGLSEERIARIHAPVGLDLGGNSAEEIALAVMAEIVRERNLRSENHF